MAAPAKRVVGWYNLEEWENVYKEIFSGQSELQRHGLGRIAVWKCRLLHRLSAGIECTWQLMTARLNDNGDENSEENLKARMEYSVALVRFVNLLTEKGQTKMYAQPVHVLAEELGLPEWLVDLRHEATHSSMPSLSLLRTAASVAINWLKREYWEEQMDVDEHPPRSPSSYIGNLSDILSNYIDLQIMLLQDENAESMEQETESLLRKIDRSLSSDRERGIETLTDTGYLVATEDQMKMMKCYNEFENSKNLVLPEILIKVWKPVLKICYHQKVIPSLLQYMISQLSAEGSLRDRILMGWVYAYMESITSKGKGSIKSGPGLYINSSDIDEKQLVDHVLELPNNYTYKLLKCIFRTKKSGFSSTQQQQLLNLLKSYARVESDDISDDGVYTLDMIPGVTDSSAGADCEKRGSRTGHGGHVNHSVWQLDTDVLDWSRYPIGSCPRRPHAYSRLELPAGVDLLGNRAKNNETDPYGTCESMEEDSPAAVEDNNDISEDYNGAPQNINLTLDIESIKNSIILL